MKAKLLYIRCAIIVLGLLTVQSANFFREFGWIKPDYSQRPPQDVFKFVTGSLPPKGVSNLKAAGRIYLGKHWIWLRFNLTDEAINQLTKGREAESKDDTNQFFGNPSQISSNNRYDEIDRKRVNWAEVAKIAQPEIYDVGHEFPDSDFSLIARMILDRRNHVAYIYAFGD